MTHLEFHCSDEKATALLKAARLYDKGVELEPVRHGRWERENIRPKSYLRVCSACGKVAYFCGEGCSYKYCPNCGAKMDGGAGDDR